VLEKPDLVLLDISMPPSNGFELLRKFNNILFEIIFTTAHSQFAIDAIKFSAVDYLLKPIDPVDLVSAIDRVRKKLEPQLGKSSKPGKLVLPTDKTFIFMDAMDIIRVEMIDRKHFVITKSHKTLTINRSLSEFEEMLSGTGFMRTHRSHIINLNEISQYIPDKYGGSVIMSDGKAVPIADRRKEEFWKYLDINQKRS
jgi:two-component system LytT family response regulator